MVSRQPATAYAECPYVLGRSSANERSRRGRCCLLETATWQASRYRDDLYAFAGVERCYGFPIRQSRRAAVSSIATGLLPGTVAVKARGVVSLPHDQGEQRAARSLVKATRELTIITSRRF